MQRTMHLTVRILLFCCILLFTAHAKAETGTVYVTIAPQKWLMDRLGGDLIQTKVLIAANQNAHTFEPTPNQIADLLSSQLYLYLDLPFEQHVVSILKKNPRNVQLVNMAKDIQPVQAEHHHDAAHTHGEVDEHHDHDQEGMDPHIWLNPQNLIRMARAGAEALQKIDPANASTYQSHLQEVVSQLEALHRDLETLLTPYKGKTFYVFHPAFGYFAQAYGLHQKAVEVEGKRPTPKQLGTLIENAKKDNVHVIFVQPQFDPRSAAVVAQAIDGRVLPLNPLAEQVAENLKHMGEAIAEALQAK
ncbi:metal ABC transporter solute-binding protein, Zn/Mn family [Desulfogranum japonicum]|uniref:metal ABC transporter solute-binding protein, Zn/Mn family n=1 Tax=Desulfogranum japonicum TaxID=231447 RepID=UPI0004021F92|nr:zinc ABC transporter substrate-binding protein [Desulfogranum japonicum]